jgi:FMN phosphatase YigB (HAD superfamily)
VLSNPERHRQLSRVRVLTFDVWATLVYPEDEVAHTVRAWTDLLLTIDPAVNQRKLDELIQAGWARMIAAWESLDNYGIEAIVADCIDTFARGHPDKDWIRRQLLNHAGTRSLQLAPRAIDCLRACVNNGLRLGVISDVGLTPGWRIQAELDRLGISTYVMHYVFSDQRGMWKPSRALFEESRVALGAHEPGSCAHVGDSRRTDVAGARGAGWRTVRYNGIKDDRSPLPDADVVIADLADLPSAIGLAGE